MMCQPRSWQYSSSSRRQFREQQVNAPVHAIVMMLDLQKLTLTDEVVPHLLGPHQHPDGVARIGKRQGEEQPRPPFVGHHLKTHARLLAVQPVDALGVELQRRPNLMQRTCQIRTDRQLHGRWGDRRHRPGRGRTRTNAGRRGIAREDAVGRRTGRSPTPRRRPCQCQRRPPCRAGSRPTGHRREGRRRWDGATIRDAYAPRPRIVSRRSVCRTIRLANAWALLLKRTCATLASRSAPAGKVASTTASRASRKPSRTQPVSSSPRASERWRPNSSNKVRPTPSVSSTRSSGP